MYASLLDENRDTRSLLIAPDRSDDPQLQRITAAGEINSCNAASLQQVVLDVLRRQHPRRFDINLRGVISLDSAGVETLLLCHADAECQGCRLRLTDPHPRVHKVLQAAGLSGRFGLPG